MSDVRWEGVTGWGVAETVSEAAPEVGMVTGVGSGDSLEEDMLESTGLKAKVETQVERTSRCNSRLRAK